MSSEFYDQVFKFNFDKNNYVLLLIISGSVKLSFIDSGLFIIMSTALYE